MTESMRQTILDCGFKPPEVTFTKKDPRGSEYGYFQVVVPSPAGNCGIRVIKRNGNGTLQWACLFDDQISFGHWAKDCT